MASPSASTADTLSVNPLRVDVEANTAFASIVNLNSEMLFSGNKKSNTGVR